LLHTPDEIEQILLIGVGRVAAQGVDTGSDVSAPAVQVDVAPSGAVGLDRPSGVAGSLVSEEEYIVARMTQLVSLRARRRPSALEQAAVHQHGLAVR
jgi:hypothetical protein